VGVCFAEISVWPDCDIFIVGVPIDFIVRATEEGICMICGSWFIFQQDIILFSLGKISYNAWSDFLGVTVVSEVYMIGVY
jgi:hypothetical protein